LAAAASHPPGRPVSSDHPPGTHPGFRTTKWHKREASGTHLLGALSVAGRRSAFAVIRRHRGAPTRASPIIVSRFPRDEARRAQALVARAQSSDNAADVIAEAAGRHKKRAFVAQPSRRAGEAAGSRAFNDLSNNFCKEIATSLRGSRRKQHPKGESPHSPPALEDLPIKPASTLLGAICRHLREYTAHIMSMLASSPSSRP
jgi:hypothetical protein